MNTCRTGTSSTASGKIFPVQRKNCCRLPAGTITETGIRSNINVGILYLESWLRGNGAAAIHNLMEDAATAEISRTQLWQWLNNKAKLDDGRIFDQQLYEDLRDDEIENIQSSVGSQGYQQGKYVEAICIFNRLVVQPAFEEFLTLSAYHSILSNAERKQCTEEILASNPLTHSSTGSNIRRNGSLILSPSKNKTTMSATQKALLMARDWEHNSRWKGIVRPYTAEDVRQTAWQSRDRIIHWPATVQKNYGSCCRNSRWYQRWGAMTGKPGDPGSDCRIWMPFTSVAGRWRQMRM